MKKVIILMSMLTSLTAIAGEELKVGVKGMVCAFCAQGIEKKFKAQKEVESVNVSLEKKLVTLKFKDGQKLPNDKIIKILKDSGYDSEPVASK
jgi:mercuric ion binding protein